MHDKIKLIREALNAAQDAEIKLSGLAIEALKEVNEYLFSVEEQIQTLESELEVLNVEKGAIPHG